MRIPGSRRLAAFALASALATGLAGAQTPTSPAQTSSAEDTAEILQLGERDHNRLTVPVRIGGKGPYAFVVDTGAERTVISSELARHLALEPGASVRVHSMSGVAEVATAMIPHLQMSRQRVSDIHAPTLGAQNIGAHGMLGIDALRSQRIEFDFRKQTMKVVPSQNRPARYMNDAIVVTARSRFGRLIMTDAELEGEKVTVVLDTGSSVSIGNFALRERLARRRKLGAMEAIEVISVTGEPVVVQRTMLRKMRLGGLDLREMPLAFAQVHPFEQLKLNDRPAMLLGMDVLSLFARVSVDFSTRKVHFLLPDLSMRPQIRVAGTTRPPALDEVVRKSGRGRARPLR
jgi:predicted aspartyl protease